MCKQTQYVYDAEGNRVAEGMITDWSKGCDLTQNGFQQTKTYIVGPGGEQMTELSVDATQTSSWVHTNVQANGRLIATYANDSSICTSSQSVPCQPLTGALHFILSDWLGTKRVQTTHDGTTESAWTNLPFGDDQQVNCTSCSGADASEQHFTGKERDTESGLDYFGARYYPSNMGRWMSPDPAGIGYADAENPQSLNLYAYVNNNPLSFVDPNGMLACGSGGAVPTATRGGAAGAVGNFFHAIGCAIQGAASAVGNALSSTVQAASTLAPPGAATAAPTAFQRLWSNYPTYQKYPSDTYGPGSFWNHAGGHVDHGEQLLNSCSLRMCYALNRSGFPIPHLPRTISDASHNWNIPRLTDLQPFLIKNFGQPRHYQANSWRKNVAGQTGIIMFKLNPRSGGWSGHAELWNGAELVNGQEHDYGNSPDATGVLFWPIQ